MGEESKNSKKKKESFEDIQGCDSARNAVRELCEVLKNPKKYEEFNARLPRGVLLVGPPGTGKTMMARAMAKEAGNLFYLYV